MDFFRILQGGTGVGMSNFDRLWSQKFNDNWPIITLSGSLPLSFLSKGGALTNYRIYGTVSGVGEETENLLDMADLINAPPGVLIGQDFDAVLELTLLPNTTYTLLSTGFGSSDASLDSDTCRSVYFNGPNRGHCVYAGRPRSAISDNDGVIKIGFVKSRTNAQQYINGSAYVCLLEGDHTSTEDDIVPYGYQIPLTVTSGAQSITIPVCIGSTKLGAEEYVDYQEQKIYRCYGEVTLKGDEKNLYYYGAFEGAQTFYLVLPDNEVSVTGTPYLSCNYYSTVYIESPAVNKTCRYRWYGSIGKWSLGRIYMFDNDYTNLSDFRAHLADLYNNGVPLKISYLLKDAPIPTDPPVPLPAINTYSGENTLSSTETIEQAEITGTIKAKENENESP